MRTTSARCLYILRDLNAPIYGTRFTLALVHKRLEEHGLLEKADMREVIPGRKLEVGPFEVEFISVTHSTIDLRGPRDSHPPWES